MSTVLKQSVLALVFAVSTGSAITLAQSGNRGAQVSIARETAAGGRGVYRVDVKNTGREGI